MTAGAIEDHNTALRARDAADPLATPIGPYDLLAPESPVRFGRELRERLDYLRARWADSRYVADREAPPPPRDAFVVPTPLPAPRDELRVALADTPLWCGPYPRPLRRSGSDFDRNACTTLRAQEPVKILSPWGPELWLVRTRFALAFMTRDTPLSPPLVPSRPGPDAAMADVFVRGPTLRLDAPLNVAGAVLPALRHVPAVSDPERIAVATATGFSFRPRPPGTVTPRPLTRRAVVEEAFRYLGKPYGWGGRDGWDCSRFVLDVLAGFGVDLPRHSAVQRQAGELTVDVTAAVRTPERLGLLDAAHAEGLVLIHFPGHIMLYLGRDDGGRPMVLHAFAEYLERCAADRGETRRTVDRIRVSDLSLGQGTSRRSFLERMTHLTILGGRPGPELLGVVARRPAAPMRGPIEGDACRNDGDHVRLWTSPRRAHVGAPLRVVAASPHDLGSVRITFYGPDGAPTSPTLHRLGGPPFGYWAQIDAPTAGRWQVQIGEGRRVEACASRTVHERGDVVQRAGPHVWRPRRSWDAHHERLFSVWVEQLFEHPFDDRTWPDLQALLTAPGMNLWYGHLAPGDDDLLALRPDCADLPYFLRAYFSWKHRLPFGFRRCNRGFAERPPYCDRELYDSLERVEAKTEIGAFQRFARRNIADGVHSGSGRTGPRQDDTDYYPLPLTREALRPGVIFADPHGHLFVVAGWRPQGVGDDAYGMLIGADAQPDGTIGRRRFWPGSFLFSPDTSVAGAGFKAFRPLSFRGGRVRAPDNEALDGQAFGVSEFSLAQYDLAGPEFYDAVERLINPRPLDARTMMRVLVDAFHEQAKRRVVSVQNGEDDHAEHRSGGPPIDMPRGRAIFQTQGPWENFSTPSRDMRLLIALDTVLEFPAALMRRPERFGVPPERAQEVAGTLEVELETTLATRHITYRRSDGSSFRLRLADIVARQRELEMAYNPNDCVEVRWAAPIDSEERSTCTRSAPAAQRERMTEYRPWFAARRRPPR